MPIGNELGISPNGTLGLNNDAQNTYCYQSIAYTARDVDLGKMNGEKLGVGKLSNFDRQNDVLNYYHSWTA